MKIMHIISLVVASFAAASYATALNVGVHEKVVAALAARDMSLDEIHEIINLMPRQEPVTVTVTPADCPPYGGASTLTPAVPVTPTTTFTTVTSSTSVTTTIYTPALSTPTSVSSETPVETPSVPSTTTTPTVETTPVPPTTPVESSVPLTPATHTPTLSSESSTVIETTSSSTATASVSTTSTSATQTTATATTSAGIPPAPNSNGAGFAGVNMGLAGLVAVLALA